MGFRLYIQSPFIDNEYHEICMGKLFGYLDNIHSYALDYLISENYIDSEDLEGVLDDDKYKAATVFFDSLLSFTIEIKYKDFLRFISLYISDRSLRFTDFYIDDFVEEFERLKAIKISDPETTIKLHWF